MSIADIKSAGRVFYGPIEASRVYYGNSLLFQSFDPDALALFDRFDTPATPERMRLISDRFTAGKATTWWTKLDALYVHAAHGAEAGRLNWLSANYNCLPVNNPTFVVDRGYNSNGTTSYLDMQFNPGTLTGINYTQNSASIGVRLNTEASVGSIAGFWTGSNGTALIPMNNTRMQAYHNSGSLVQSASGSVTSSIGMFVSSRTASNVVRLFRQGSLVTNGSAVSAAIPSGSFRFGVVTGSSSAAQFAMGFVGGGLTDAEVASIYEWFQPYRTALGIA